MIVAMQDGAKDDQIQHVVEHLVKMGFAVHRTTGVRQTILAAVGARIDFDMRDLEVLPGVQEVYRVSAPYKLAGRSFRPEGTIVDLPYGVKIGGKEVVVISQIPLMMTYVDVLQVGARNMQNFNLLRELGKIRKPILLKRGIAATLEELLLSAEYLLSGGNYEIILCERGIRTFETSTRNTMDISAIPVVKSLSHLPIIADPSHGTGRRDKVLPMARAAVAAGADGLLIEVHHDPDHALSDGAQSLRLQQFEELMEQLKIIAAAVGRSI